MRRTILFLVVFALVLASCGGGTEEAKPSGTRTPGASASATVHAGTIAFLAADLGGAPDIYLINTDGTGLTRLTSDADAGNPYWSGSPAWSPDGTRIAWGGSDSSVGGDVWVMNADGSEKTQLTHGSVDPNWPVWSPDGTRIAFAESRPDFGIAISVMDADGSGVRRVTSGPYDLLPAWAPDGTILFLRAHPSNDKGDVFAVAPDGSGLVRLTRRRHVGGYGLSPDGTRLAVHDAQQHRIVILPVDGSGGAPVTLLDDDFGFDCISPAWSPDGQALALARCSLHPSYGSDVYVVNVDGSGLAAVPNTGLAVGPTWRPT